MENNAETFLNLRELLAIFSRLKSLESSLTGAEREVLLKIEKILYGRLSIQEIELAMADTAGGVP
ncbi:hypothetical protein FACS189468_9130 [Spirochaetia bacterium]|nr:hypothetical protein FACS189468_9130 [Spirochaetia bacterium]